MAKLSVFDRKTCWKIGKVAFEVEDMGEATAVRWTYRAPQSGRHQFGVELWQPPFDPDVDGPVAISYTILEVSKKARGMFAADVLQLPTRITQQDLINATKPGPCPRPPPGGWPGSLGPKPKQMLHGLSGRRTGISGAGRGTGSRGASATPWRRGLKGTLDLLTAAEQAYQNNDLDTADHWLATIERSRLLEKKGPEIREIEQRAMTLYGKLETAKRLRGKIDE